MTRRRSIQQRIGNLLVGRSVGTALETATEDADEAHLPDRRHAVAVGFIPVACGDARAARRPHDIGTTDLIAGFADLSQTFGFGGAYTSPTTQIIGVPDYAQAVSLGKRTLTSVGAED